jgi:hypothetical protein
MAGGSLTAWLDPQAPHPPPTADGPQGTNVHLMLTSACCMCSKRGMRQVSILLAREVVIVWCHCQGQAHVLLKELLQTSQAHHNRQTVVMDQIF